jgi:hypothetical protein
MYMRLLWLLRTLIPARAAAHASAGRMAQWVATTPPSGDSGRPSFAHRSRPPAIE